MDKNFDECPQCSGAIGIDAAGFYYCLDDLGCGWVEEDNIPAVGEENEELLELEDE